MSPQLFEHDPEPGARLLRFRGDVLAFRARFDAQGPGEAFLRTNLGRGRLRRTELIDQTERARAILARDWHDIPMRRDGNAWVTDVALTEPGLFLAKAFFLPAESDEPVWPEGPNVQIKVEPAHTVRAGTLYGTFVRQFGSAAARPPGRELEKAIAGLDQAGYTVIPRSGTFRDLVRQLDLIVGRMRCRILQLLPIHPTPTTFARMGRFGSPYAALDFMDIDPALAEFDRLTTPLDQFHELLLAVHARGARLFLDIPANHTGWASTLQIHFPHWFPRNRDRTFRSPGAWGTTWEDLAELDYRHRGLWTYMAEVFLYWCRQGVDGFRCDAGYMVPVPVWTYVTAKVREQFPDTVFLLEGLGGKLSTVNTLLTDGGMDWAYSELFQNEDRSQIEHYLPGALQTSHSRGLLVHFAETHDNNRLAARSQTYARMRTALCALCSVNGGFGFSNGVEWFATEKIDVHGAPSLNWGADTHQIDLIARLNVILSHHACFAPATDIALIQRNGGNVVALRRRVPHRDARLLVLANLSDDRPAVAAWDAADFPPAPGSAPLTDLLTGLAADVSADGARLSCNLDPGQVLCLSPDPADAERTHNALHQPAAEPPDVRLQRLRAAALDLLEGTRALRAGRASATQPPAAPSPAPSVAERDAVARALGDDPLACLDALFGETLAPVTTWTWPADLKRVVPVPAGHFLLVRAPHPFRIECRSRARTLHADTSVACRDGHFALLPPPPPPPEPPPKPTPCALRIEVFFPRGPDRASGTLLHLAAEPRPQAFRTAFTSREVLDGDLYGLCTNGRGAMAQVRGAWSEIRSQYDALLAANLSDTAPVDRHVMLTRCRAWIVHRGYSQPLNRDSLRAFGRTPSGDLFWRFDVPVGMGMQINLEARLHMVRDANAVRLAFRLVTPPSGAPSLPAPVRLIVRPDIEDRSFHETTKAFLGPETGWPPAVQAAPASFVFAPAPGRHLTVAVSDSRFTLQPEWSYMVPHPVEARRGLESAGDLFSPGFFEGTLTAGTPLVLLAGVSTDPARAAAAVDIQDPVPEVDKHGDEDDLDARLGASMRQFIVRRDHAATVIAGYPWFLDWGRDTLICLRGLMAAGFMREARTILERFASFESAGTLPNMIHGDDDSNRDTSDAPLWFIVACAELADRCGGMDVLRTRAGNRTLADVARSIARHYLQGTPNGIRVDPESGLVFSPSHFTWMDTNHPASTPREGYPIEIQALWFASLAFLERLDGDAPLPDWRQKLAHSILRYYRLDGHEGLSDCLHAGPGVPASAADADDHVRPNQLLALTLGAVQSPDAARDVLRVCQRLLVPGAIRSLADQRVSRRLPVQAPDGTLLNDPEHPYWGTYRGREDTRRKPAYHNGTAWTWLFPSYAEALVRVYGAAAQPTALSLLTASQERFSAGCIGHFCEIVEGDAPHEPRGCGAQAWSMAEYQRVLAFLRAMR